MDLHAHFIPAVLLAPLAVEASAYEGATPYHYLAVGGVITAIVAVVKGYDWVERKIKTMMDDALKLHNLEDERRHDKIHAEIGRLATELERRPCIAGKCANRCEE